jgi:hypothetical protein
MKMVKPPFASGCRAAALLAAVGVLSGASLAQGNVDNSVGVAPTSIGTTGKAVVDSTQNYFPQINRSLKQRPFTPPNPTPAFPPAPPRNNLVNGQMVKDPIGEEPMGRFPGIGFTGSLPPDPDIAVGPRHVLQVVNGAVAIFDKGGQLLFQQPDSNTGFWSGLGATSFIFDPKCFYDPISKRFFIVEPELDGPNKLSFVLVAVSDDDNPLGTWNKYRIDCKVKNSDTDQYWLDYPGFGYSKDFVVITGNMFPLQETGGVFSQAIVIPKAPLLTGAAASTNKYNVMDTFTIQGVKNPDPAVNAVYGVANGNFVGNTLNLFAWTGTGANNRMIRSTVAVPSYSFATGRFPTRNGNTLDAIPGRMMSAYGINGNLLATHTSGDTAGRRSVVAWYHMNIRNWPGTALPSLVQSGELKLPGSAHSVMPSIAMNNLGDISVVYTRGDSSIFPEAVVSARKVSDARGVMGSPRIFGTSAGAHAFGRFGDYSDVEVDPANGYTFWGVANTFGANNSWTTTIGSWNVSVPSDLVVGQAPNTATVVQGTLLGGTVASLRAADRSFFAARSAKITNVGEAVQIDATYRTTVARAKITDLAFANAAQQDGGELVAGSLFAFNVVTRKWDLLRTANLTNNTNVNINANVGGASALNYVATDGTVMVRFRSFESVTRTRGVPKPHTFNVDKMNLSVTSS